MKQSVYEQHVESLILAKVRLSVRVCVCVCVLICVHSHNAYDREIVCCG